MMYLLGSNAGGILVFYPLSLVVKAHTAGKSETGHRVSSESILRQISV